MTDEHTIRGVDRLENVYRVHSAAKKEKKEDRKKRERDFRELLEQGAKETEAFVPEQTFGEKVQLGAKSLLGGLSAATPLVEIVEDKAGDEKKNGGGQAED